MSSSILPHNNFYNARRQSNRRSPNAINLNNLKLNSLLGLNDNQYTHNDSSNVYDYNDNNRVIVKGSAPPIQSASTLSLHSFKLPPDHFNSTPPKKPVYVNGRLVRNFKLFKGNIRFFLNGNMLTSGDNPIIFIISIILVVGIPAVFIGRISIDLWYQLSPAIPIIAAYLTLIVWSSMIKTAFSDPGILPRNIDSNPINTYPRDVTLRDGLIRIKYCEICQIFRPPRTSHCRLCDCCVDGIDHHCSFLNICIGRRNYFPFLVFCSSTVITLIYFIVFSALHISLLSDNRYVHSSEHQKQSFIQAVRQDPASAVIFLVSIIFLIPLSLLLLYHLRVCVVFSKSMTNRLTIKHSS